MVVKRVKMGGGEMEKVKGGRMIRSNGEYLCIRGKGTNCHRKKVGDSMGMSNRLGGLGTGED